jgi:hypothetical protein
MNNDYLVKAFAPLQGLGFRLIRSDIQIVYEGDHHRILVSHVERANTLDFDITLKSLPKSWVDCYSIIGRYCPADLDQFINSKTVLSDAAIVEFVIGKLMGDCAAVFTITDSSEWMRLHQFHKQSMHRRNESFWATVSGYRDTYWFTSGKRFEDEPRPAF